MTRTSDKYATFVDHPRYGQGPNITGLNPSPRDRTVNLHWNALVRDEIAAVWEAATGEQYPYGRLVVYSDRRRRIPNTAIAADLSRQVLATVPVTHYFDMECKCRDCGRQFIFFAKEQKHWYEDLGFSLNSDCVRCVECRKQQQGLGQERERYEMLCHVPERTVEQCLQMAESCLSLIESDVFSKKQVERVRMLLNAVPDDADVRKHRCFGDIIKRLHAIEGDDGRPAERKATR
jgi:Probable zinc-ribbon domain